MRDGRVQARGRRVSIAFRLNCLSEFKTHEGNGVRYEKQSQLPFGSIAFRNAKSPVKRTFVVTPELSQLPFGSIAFRNNPKVCITRLTAEQSQLPFGSIAFRNEMWFDHFTRSNGLGSQLPFGSFAFRNFHRTCPRSGRARQGLNCLSAQLPFGIRAASSAPGRPSTSRLNCLSAQLPFGIQAGRVAERSGREGVSIAFRHNCLSE